MSGPAAATVRSLPDGSAYVVTEQGEAPVTVRASGGGVAVTCDANPRRLGARVTTMTSGLSVGLRHV